jgi:hypothetical protein
MKKSTFALVAGLVLVLVVTVGYLFYHQGELQARLDQQQKESAALLAKQKRDAELALEEAKRPKFEHRTDVLSSGMLTIPSATVQTVRVTVDPETMHNVQVSGRFSAVGGSDSGIEVFIFDQDNYTNWANGHESRALYNSGLKTVGDVDTALPSKAGTYYVVFSNKHAVLFSRTVSADVKLDYDKRIS